MKSSETKSICLRFPQKMSSPP